MIENVVAVFGLPLGVATNFQINGRDVLIPMAIEEPSVVAGASFMAKLAREGGGFQASTTEPEMIGQIQVLDLPDPQLAMERIRQAKDEILSMANEVDPLLLRLGGGARARLGRRGHGDHRALPALGRFGASLRPAPPDQHVLRRDLPLGRVELEPYRGARAPSRPLRISLRSAALVRRGSTRATCHRAL